MPSGRSRICWLLVLCWLLLIYKFSFFAVILPVDIFYVQMKAPAGYLSIIFLVYITIKM